MKNNGLFILFLLILFTTTDVHSQATEAYKPLSTVLTDLQQRFGVQFNYASDLVEDVTVPLPNISLELEDYLQYLELHSDLNYVQVSKKIVTIKQKNLVLCGYIKDKDTGENLPFVTVQNGKIGTIANEDGFFEIPIKNKSDIIQIRHIGHKPLEREAVYFNYRDCISIYLVPNQEKLAEVIVYDYIIKGIDKLDNGTYQIDFNKFSILPGLIDKDVLHAVQAFPGIQSVDETVSNINIRGGSNDQNLITWDGIKMYQSGHFFGLISMYNPDITQTVQLQKNGSSASQTDGVSGTIAMETSDFINPKAKGSLGINLLDANGAVDAPIGEHASLQLAGRKSINSIVETPTYSKYFDRISQETELEQNTTAVQNSDIKFNFYDAALRFLYHPSNKDHFKLNFIHTENEVLFNENAEIDNAQERRESNLVQSSTAAGIAYKRQWSENLNSEITAYNTDYKLRAINVNILADQRFLQKNEVSETGIKVKTKSMVTENMSWTNGYHFIETKVTNLDDVDSPSFIELTGEVLRVHAVFSEVGLSSNNNNSKLNLGLRYNYLDKFSKSILEPRLSFNHKIGSYFNVELLGEFKHQNTSQVINFQNDFLGLEKRRWQLSNNNTIPVITSKQGSVGLTYNRNGWLWNTVFYNKHVKGITTQSQGFQNDYALVAAIGSYNSNGLDMLVKKQYNNLDLWLGYSFLESNYYFHKIKEINFASNYDITHSFTLGGTYVYNSILFSTGLNWRTGRPFTSTVTNNEIVDGNINYAGTNEVRQSDYLRLDISGKKNIQFSDKTKMEIGLSIWNLLNRENSINTFYRINNIEEVNKTSQSSLGITPNVSLKLIF
jgi:hypothetical protein